MLGLDISHQPFDKKWYFIYIFFHKKTIWHPQNKLQSSLSKLSTSIFQLNYSIDTIRIHTLQGNPPCWVGGNSSGADYAPSTVGFLSGKTQTPIFSAQFHAQYSFKNKISYKISRGISIHQASKRLPCAHRITTFPNIKKFGCGHTTSQL